MGRDTGIDLDAMRKRLEKRRTELTEVGAASADSRRPVELDQTRVGRLSRMDAMQAQAMSLEQERRREIELKRIEAALRRMAEGEYGYCAKCGAEIAVRRLDVDPTTPLCRDCAGG